MAANVAELPASCCSDPGFHNPGTVAIAPDGARGLLACQREPPLLVTLGTGAVKALPGPGRGRLGKLTFGKDGAPLALTVETEVKFLEDERGRFANVDGQRIDASEGSESLVHAFRLGEGGAWSRVETIASFDPEKGDVLGKLGTGKGQDRVPVSSEVLSLSPEFDAQLSPIKDPKMLTKLKALAPEFSRPPYALAPEFDRPPFQARHGGRKAGDHPCTRPARPCAALPWPSARRSLRAPTG